MGLVTPSEKPCFGVFTFIILLSFILASILNTCSAEKEPPSSFYTTPPPPKAPPPPFWTSSPPPPKAPKGSKAPPTPFWDSPPPLRPPTANESINFIINMCKKAQNASSDPNNCESYVTCLETCLPKFEIIGTNNLSFAVVSLNSSRQHLENQAEDYRKILRNSSINSSEKTIIEGCLKNTVDAGSKLLDAFKLIKGGPLKKIRLVLLIGEALYLEGMCFASITKANPEIRKHVIDSLLQHVTSSRIIISIVKALIAILL